MLCVIKVEFRIISLFPLPLDLSLLLLANIIRL